MRNLMRTGASTAALLCACAGFGHAQTHDGDATDGQAYTFLHPYRGDINPFYGDINPFWGDINPFRGDINPFYGDISPFWGDINPFWGDINPFYGDINPFTGDINPFWGDINPFGGDINPFWNDINPFWQAAGPAWGDINDAWQEAQASGGDYDAVASALQALLNDANAVFGDAITAQSGQSMDEAFLTELLARFGIDPNDPDSLADVSIAARAEFFLTFYDTLMSYSGVDHIDHWMPAINWSPALVDRYYWGYRPRVGVLDFNINDVDLGVVRAQLGDQTAFASSHGDAVASLIASPIDGVGIMGVNPNASLSFYNPFDESLTAGWQDVEAGVQQLALGGNRVINMSLGVPGWTLHPEWANVFEGLRNQRFSSQLTYVIAAGNDGSSQSVDIDWSRAGNPDNIIIVGSVGPTGQISSFSNQPGTACLVTFGECREGNRLMDRFLVAPGELLLVSDGQGGVTRASGTSFAAPLVSGAASLVQSWWYWLDGSEVADVLLMSARDLGAPGTDPVYGRGMLDVAGAMSPLNPDDLYAINRRGRAISAGDIMITGGRLRLRTYFSGQVTTFENIGNSFRDFSMPVNDLVVGNTLAQNIADSFAEQYIYERVGAGFSQSAFADTAAVSQVMDRRGNLTFTARATDFDPLAHSAFRSLGFQASLRIEDETTGKQMEFGLGEGAVALARQDGFGLYSDYRAETGGVNPILGLASGGAYATVRYTLSDTTRVSYGVTATYEHDEAVMPGTGEAFDLYPDLAPYRAAAVNVSISHDLNDGLSLSVSATQLHESSGLLGTQGASVLALEGGTDTTAVTVGLEARPLAALGLSASVTSAMTARTGFDGEVLSISERVDSTAAQISMMYEGLFGERDGLRLSLVQPLHIESGSLEYTAMHVANRETGELGLETQTWALGGDRSVYAEMIYATPLGSERAQLSLFAREQLAGEALGSNAFSQAVTGVRFQLDF